jgi:hypothetical protein
METYGYKSRTVHTLTKVFDEETIDFPEDSSITCKLIYDSLRPATNSSILILSQSFVGFEFDNDTNSINTYPLESGSRTSHFMKVFK